MYLFHVWSSHSQLLSPSLPSYAPSTSCAFRSAASSAAFKHRSGCYHSDFIATVTVLTGAAAPPLRWSCSRLRHLHWEGLLAGAAHILRRCTTRFENDLRAQKPSSCLSPPLLPFSSSLRTLACRLPSFTFGWGRHFLLTVLLLVLSSFSLFSLHAGDCSAKSLAADRMLFLLLHAEECVDPQLSLNQDGEEKKKKKV